MNSQQLRFRPLPYHTPVSKAVIMHVQIYNITISMIHSLKKKPWHLLEEIHYYHLKVTFKAIQHAPLFYLSIVV